MRNVWLIAGHEFWQVIRTRGFWISVLFAPVLGYFAGSLPRWIDSAQGPRPYVLIDQTGRYDAVLEQARETSHQRQVLAALIAYAKEHVAETGVFLSLPVLGRSGELGDAEVAAFADAGLESYLAQIRPALRPGAPAFVAPERRFVRVPAPAGIDVTADGRLIGAALTPHLLGQETVSGPGVAPQALNALIIIPAGFTPGTPLPGNALQFWSTNIAEPALLGELRRILRVEVQREAYQARGIDPALVAAVEGLGIAVDSYNPAASREALGLSERLIQFVPLALSFLLWMVSFLVGGILLTNTIEERSNKLVEVLLSSVSATQLMIGKLLGVGSTGLLILVFWIGFALIALFGSQGEVAEFGRQVLGLVFESNLLPFFLFYFLASYLMITAVYLAVGSVANTLQDSQGYLVPISLVMLSPLLLSFIILSDANGVIARVMTWIPLFTPFVMMLRLPANPPAFEIYGSAVVLVIFVAYLLWAVGWIYRTNILRAGQPIAWRQMLTAPFRRG